MQNECSLLVNGKCRLTEHPCARSFFNFCDVIQEAYQLGKTDGYKEAEAMNYYEGSGIGGFHDY